MKIFKDRQAAGRLLANRLKHYFNDRGTIVLAIPRGGVVVAKEIANQLKLPLDIVVTRKIGAPIQPELALGAVDGDGGIVWDEELVKDLGTKLEDLGEVVKSEWNEVKRREDTYRDGKQPLNVEGQTIILVDDGVATGSTIISAIRYLKRHNVAKLVIAVPVASQDIVQKLTREVSEMVVLHTPESFQSVGEFYNQFNSVSDAEVVEILRYAQDDNED